MGSIESNVVGSSQTSDAVSYTFSEVTTNTLMTDTIFKNLGVKINQERARRGKTADSGIDAENDFNGTIQYAEMEKLRSALAVAGPTNATYYGLANGGLLNNTGTAKTGYPLTFAKAGSGFTTNPGTIEAGPQNEWTGYPKITAALFNSLIKGLKEQGAECVCNCNYCTCNCNYCTCNCNFSCTCNCNYSDVTTKNNIVYM